MREDRPYHYYSGGSFIDDWGSSDDQDDDCPELSKVDNDDIAKYLDDLCSDMSDLLS